MKDEKPGQQAGSDPARKPPEQPAQEESGAREHRSLFQETYERSVGVRVTRAVGAKFEKPERGEPPVATPPPPPPGRPWEERQQPEPKLGQVGGRPTVFQEKYERAVGVRVTRAVGARFEKPERGEPPVASPPPPPPGRPWEEREQPTPRRLGQVGGTPVGSPPGVSQEADGRAGGTKIDEPRVTRSTPEAQVQHEAKAPEPQQSTLAAALSRLRRLFGRG